MENSADLGVVASGEVESLDWLWPELREVRQKRADCCRSELK